MANKEHAQHTMSFLKSKGFWATILTTLIVMAIVNRIPAIRTVVVGA